MPNPSPSNADRTIRASHLYQVRILGHEVKGLGIVFDGIVWLSERAEKFHSDWVSHLSAYSPHDTRFMPGGAGSFAPARTASASGAGRRG